MSITYQSSQLRPSNSTNSSSIASAYSNQQASTIPNRELFTYTHYGPEGIEGRLRILPDSHSRALQTGQDLLSQQPLVLLGISTNNSFFNRKRIEIAVCGMAHLFDEVTVLLPDSVAVHTYRALGYDEQKVQAKARAEGQKTKNRIKSAIERAQLDSPTTKLRLLEWGRDITTLPGYWDAYSKVCQLFDTNVQFQKDVRAKGHSVLAKKLPDEAITPDSVRECIEYLLREFAYMMLCREAWGRDLVFPYHQDSAVAHGFCDGEYQEPLPGVGWLIFEIELIDELENQENKISDHMVHPT